MTSILATRYDRTTTQLLTDALRHAREDARSNGLGLGMTEDGRPGSAGSADFRPQLEDRIRVLDSRSRHDFAVVSSHLVDLCSSLSALMRAGLVLSWVPNTVPAFKPAVTVEREWEREEDWQRLFM